MPLKEPDPLLAEGKPTQPHPSSSPSRLSDLWEAQILLGGRWIFEDGSNIPKAQIHPDSDSQRSSAIAVALRRGNHSYLQISYRCFPFFSGLLNITSGLAWFCPSGPKKRPFLHSCAQCESHEITTSLRLFGQDSVRMEAGFRKYVHREVDYKRLADKEKRRKKKEMPRSSWVIRKTPQQTMNTVISEG